MVWSNGASLAVYKFSEQNIKSENDVKKISILGAGRVSTALAAGFMKAGYEVVVGTRASENPPNDWRVPGVVFMDHERAAQESAVIINATPGDTSLERLSKLRQSLRGKILVDVSNATIRGSDGMPGDLVFPNSSLAERLQSALPETHIVKTLNTMLSVVMAAPHILKTPPTAFLSGNDAEAKALVTGLLNDLGWPIAWIADLGDVFSARGTEALFPLVPFIFRTFGMQPFALTIAR